MTTRDYALARRMWHQLEPVHAVFWYAPEVFAEAADLGFEVTTRWPSRDARDEIEWRTDRLADAPWLALGPGRAQRLAELALPLLGAAFESGLLPSQSTLGIATVPPPAPRT